MVSLQRFNNEGALPDYDIYTGLVKVIAEDKERELCHPLVKSYADEKELGSQYGVCGAAVIAYLMLSGLRRLQKEGKDFSWEELSEAITKNWDFSLVEDTNEPEDLPTRFHIFPLTKDGKPLEFTEAFSANPAGTVKPVENMDDIWKILQSGAFLKDQSFITRIQEMMKRASTKVPELAQVVGTDFMAALKTEQVSSLVQGTFKKSPAPVQKVKLAIQGLGR